MRVDENAEHSFDRNGSEYWMTLCVAPIQNRYGLNPLDKLDN